jgi:hypothetical protein
MFPNTIQWGVVAGTLVALLGLTIHQPPVLLATLSGAFLGAGLAGLSGKPSRVMLAAALYPVGLVTFVASVGGISTGLVGLGGLGGSAEFEAYTAIVTLVGALFGLVLASMVTGTITQKSAPNANMSTLSGLLFGLLLSWCGYLFVTTAESSLFVFADTTLGFIRAVTTATITLSVAILFVPKAALTSPSRSEAFDTGRRQALALVFLSALLLVGVVVGFDLVGLDGVVLTLASSTVVRWLLGVVTGASILLTLLGAITSYAWKRTESQESVVVPVLAGTCLGITFLVGAILHFGPKPEWVFAVPGLVGAGGFVLAALWWLYGLLGGNGLLSESLPDIFLGLCVLGTLGIGGSVGKNVHVSLSGLALTLTLSAGVFVYAVGRWGVTLSTEVKTVTRRPQLVQLAAVATIVTASAAVALLGYVVAIQMAPQFSTAATVGLTGAFLTFVVLLTRFRQLAGDTTVLSHDS